MNKKLKGLIEKSYEMKMDLENVVSEKDLRVVREYFQEKFNTNFDELIRNNPLYISDDWTSSIEGAWVPAYIIGRKDIRGFVVVRNNNILGTSIKIDLGVLVHEYTHAVQATRGFKYMLKQRLRSGLNLIKIKLLGANEFNLYWRSPKEIEARKTSDEIGKILGRELSGGNRKED